MSRQGPHVVAARALYLDLRGTKVGARLASIRRSWKCWPSIDTHAKRHRKWSFEQELMTLLNSSSAEYGLRFVFG